MDSFQQSTERGTRIEIQVTQKETIATCIIKGPYDPSITIYSINRLLADNGIVRGLMQKEITKLIEDYKKAAGKHQVSAIVARGVPATLGKNGYHEILIEKTPGVIIKEDGSADFRNIEKYKSVEKGQVVARYFPPVKGKQGVNVYDQIIFPPDVIDDPLSYSDNIEYNENTHEFIAKVMGIFQQSGKKINIDPILEISQNVGIESGNLNYEGDIEIAKNIEKGAKVIAKGNVHVKGMVETSLLTTYGDLQVGRGIHAGKENTIMVGGNLKVSHIEESQILVYGDALVKTSILGSDLVVINNLTLSDKKGSLVGGEIKVFKNIEIPRIGNRNEAKTIIHIGLHSKFNEEYQKQKEIVEEIEKKYKQIQPEIIRIKEYVERNKTRIRPEKVIQIREKFDKYKKFMFSRERQKQKFQEYKMRRFNDEEVLLIVKGIVHPGVIVYYYENLFKITEEYQNTVFRFRPGLKTPIIQSASDL